MVIAENLNEFFICDHYTPFFELILLSESLRTLLAKTNETVM